jgi:phosphoglycerol transferase
MRTYEPADTSRFLTWQRTLASEWKLVFVGAVVSFFLASIFMSGLHDGLVPDLSRPYGYGGDGLFHAWMAQRVTEGWLFDNVRSGYPFGSNFLDFPGSDSGDHLLIKIFSLIGGGWPAGVKLFFLSGFSVCFAATYVTARAFGLNRSFAVTATVLYTFAPFHFTRLQHLFYTWYFVAPLFFYLALDVYLTREPDRKAGIGRKLRKFLLTVVGMLILASFGVYYALFGVIVLATAGVMSAVESRSRHGSIKAALLIGATVFGVFVNIAPNMLGTIKNGPNLEVAQRQAAESEIYGLKMMQLLMPRPDHRIPRLSEAAQRYNRDTPLVNENATSSVGIIGAIGFLLALLYLSFIPARTDSDHRLRLLSVTTFVLFLFATIGGLGSLFALIASPSIRGWNRNSIFIAFGALFFFFISLHIMLQKKSARSAYLSASVAALLLLVGLFDQTAEPSKVSNSAQRAEFDSDRNFVQAIEKMLPAQASVYQLPYIGFPEVPPLHGLTNYQMMAGVLHSKALHWSFGGMKGRPGDLFYRGLAQEPMFRQVNIIQRLGFEGIYIDRRGYKDNGEALIQELSQLLQHPPTLQSENGQLVFFKLDSSAHPHLRGLSVKEIGDIAGYFADALGPRYAGNLESGIDFSRKIFPDFIRGVEGLHAVESWGRWSSEPDVVFEFTKPLPQKFTLILKAQAYAVNAQKPTRVRIGNREYDIQLTSNISDVRLDVDLAGSSAERITFIPPEPASPQQVSGSTDERVLGIGFISMRIIQ